MGKTRRGGRKYQLRKLTESFHKAQNPKCVIVSNEVVALNLAGPTKTDNLHQKIIQQGQSGELEFDRREGYNPLAPWPFQLIPIDETSKAVPPIDLSTKDPRGIRYCPPEEDSLPLEGKTPQQQREYSTSKEK